MRHKNDIAHGAGDRIHIRFETDSAHKILIAVQLIHTLAIRLCIGRDAVKSGLRGLFFGVRIVGIGIDCDSLTIVVVYRIGVGQFHAVRPIACL